MKNKRIGLLWLMSVSLLLVAVTGCKAGMSKADRLTEFKADILATRSPVNNFKGQAGSSLVDYGTVTTTGLNNDSSNLVYTGDSITGDTFTINFTVGAGPDYVTGVFFNDGGGVGGDDWYIYSLTDSSGSVTIP